MSELRITEEQINAWKKAWKKAETEVKTTPVKLPEFIKEASQIHTQNLAASILNNKSK